MTTFKTNDNVEISYHVQGDSAQTIILLNGYSASEITWAFQVQELIEAGFRVLTFDYRGHGKSEKVDYGMTIHRLAMDLQELLKHLAIERAVFMGHSMGAVLINAYEELFTDEKIIAIITEDQAPYFGHDLKEIDCLIDNFPKIKLTEKQLSDQVKRELGRGMLPFDFKRYRGLLKNVVLQNWSPNLAHERVPHLFLVGEKSPIFPPERSQEAFELSQNPQSEIYVFEGCGHIPHIESIEEFNHLVINYIKKLA